MFTKADRWAVFVLSLLTIYFGIALLTHRWPAIGQTQVFFFYSLSIPLVTAALLVVAVAASFVWMQSRWQRTTRPTIRPLLIWSAGGLLMFVTTVVAANRIARQLPTGSHVRPFDRAAWNHPRSSDSVEGDITPRQKMLADVVNRVLPGKTRQEIEEKLGASLDSPYFGSSGRDLIYVTGPERDSMFAIDSEWLLIWLDESGRFERYEIATD
jgi:hypothetical protein